MAKRPANLTKAVAYLRTSSQANVGPDKDSERRQREAIRAFAMRSDFEVVETYFDAAVSGADAVDERPGFNAMMKRIEGNGVRTIIVETASRFARDLMVQEVGYAMLTARGIDLVAADSPSSFLDDGPTSRLIRQVLGAVSEFDRAITVAKLRGARDRKRMTGVKVEGRKSLAEVNPELVSIAKRLFRKNPKTGTRRSLREIGNKLAVMGFVSATARPLSPSVVKRLIDAQQRSAAPANSAAQIA